MTQLESSQDKLDPASPPRDWSDLSASNPRASESEYFYRVDRYEPAPGLRPRFLGMKLVTITEDSLYPNHWHKEYEIVAILQGPYSCELNGKRLTLDAGEALLVKPGDQHHPAQRRGQQHLIIHFQLPTSSGGCQLLASHVTPDCQVVRIAPSMTLALLESFKAEGAIDDAFSPVLQDGLMEAYFWRVVRALPPASRAESLQRDATDQQFRNRLLRFLANNLERSLTLDEIAVEMGISKRTLTKRCRETLGDSPMNRFASMRMEKAVRLLQGTSSSVKRVAYLMGFDDPFQFSRAFKRVTGRSPTSFQGSR